MATVTFAASQQPAAAPAVTPPTQPVEKAEPVVVPDVRRQAYVFAKGTLEDAGFSWRVRGAVHGFAANVVVAQAPAPGTRLVDTGAPTITLTLKKNGRYAEKGSPDDVAPFAGTPVRPADLAAVRTTKPKATPVAKPKAKAVKAKAKAKPDVRTPAFVVPGAPKEPLDEIRLDARARALGSWVSKHRAKTDANVQHWSYQHAWVVTGARFGWSHGADALRILIAVDRKVEASWRIGAGSRAVAEQALADVRKRSR